MYQNRNEDLDPRVSNVLNDGPKISMAFDSVQNRLQNLHEIKENKNRRLNVNIGNPYEYNSQGHAPPANTQTFTGELCYDLPKDWEYHKEYKETVDNMNKSVLDAYITLLECEREALIKRWNDMAKELKPEKK